MGEARTVYAFDAHDGAPVGSYPSIGAAGRALNVSRTQVRGCLAGEHGHAHGYMFSYDGECPPLPSRVGRFWTIERCLEEAKKYRTKSEFKRNACQAYHCLRKARRLDECGFEERRKPSGWYTKERCFEIARGCRTRDEVRKASSRVYHLVLVNGWWSEMPWIELPTNIHVNGWSLYTYEFPDGCVYVGITTEPDARDRAHRGLDTKKKSAVYRHHLESGLMIPEMKVVLSGLSAKEASDEEKRFVEMYRRDISKTVLNKAEPGSLGGTYRKWVSDDVIEAEARKYRTASEFFRENRGAYCAASRRGLLKKWDFFEDGRELYLNDKKNSAYDRCFELARKFDGRGRFKKAEPSAYATARVNGWLDDYTWMKKVYHETWTPESIREHVKDRGYKTLVEFMKDSGGAYAAALRLGLSAEDLGLERQVHRYTDEEVRTTASKCGNLHDFKVNHGGEYSYAWRHGILDDLGLERTVAKAGAYTDDEIRRIVRENNCRTRIELYRCKKWAYKKAIESGLIDELFPGKQAKEVYAFRADDGSFVGRYRSQGEAARALGVQQTCISECLRGRNSRARDYVFSYDEKCPALPQTHEKGFWTVENALKTANENKDMTRTEFERRYYQAWHVLKKNGLADGVGFRSAKPAPPADKPR